MTIDDHDDAAIRQALRQTFGDVAPTRTADLEQAIDARVQQRTRRRHTARGVAALACVTAILAVVAVGTTRDQEAKVTTGPPEATDDSGFAAWGPGWHELDTGPVPGSDETSTAWTGSELIVAAGLDTFAYDPTTRQWTTLGTLPFDAGSTATLVGASEHVVAVSDATSDDLASTGEAAFLDLGDSSPAWTKIDGPNVTTQLVAAGSLGPRGAGRHGLALVWTGERVIDLTRGAVLDPGGWTWTPLDLPDSLTSFTHLLGSIPVWDGTRVVLVAASTGPGLTWDATGGDLQEISGIPLDQTAELGGFTAQAAVTSDEDGSVVVVGYLGEGSLMAPVPAWRLVTATGAWSPLPSVPSLQSCFPNAATVGGSVLAPVCYSGLEPGIVHLADEWTPIDALPDVEVAHGSWTSASDALVVWSASDTPGPRAWVWLPTTTGDADTAETTPTTGIVVADPTLTPAEQALAELGAGWHELDPGPVPASAETSTAWTGSELIVTANLESFAYSPSSQTWRSLGPVPFEEWDDAYLLTTDRGTLAVSWGFDDRAEAAVLDPDSSTWREIDGPMIAPALRGLGMNVPKATRWGGAALLWTGEAVIDLTHGAVLDTTTWSWTELALPEDASHLGALLTTTPVWTGTDVVLAPAGRAPGLAWDATGDTVRETPGIPEDLLPVPDYIAPAVALAPEPGVVVLIAGVDLPDAADTNSWRLDVASGGWQALPLVPGMVSSEGCPAHSALVTGIPVLTKCEWIGSDQVVSLQFDGTWASTGEPSTLAAYGSPWLSTPGALVVWSSDTDTLNNPDAPYVEAWIWIPPTD